MSSIRGGGSSDIFTLAGGVPVNQSSAGHPYQVAFDAQGNLYICYSTNTWAKYTDVWFGMLLPRHEGGAAR